MIGRKNNAALQRDIFDAMNFEIVAGAEEPIREDAGCVVDWRYLEDGVSHARHQYVHR
jgi:hypothetical protein